MEPKSNSLNVEESEEKFVENHEFNNKFYLLLKCLNISLMGFGCRLNHSLKCDDNFKKVFNKWILFFNSYQFLFIIVIHLSLIASVVPLIARFVPFLDIKPNFDYSLQTNALKAIIIICSLTAIFIIDSTFCLRDSRTKLMIDLCDNQFIQIEDIDEHQWGKQPMILRLLRRFLSSKFFKLFDSNFISFSIFFTIPIICFIYFSMSLTLKILNKNWYSMEIPFFTTNLVLILNSMLNYTIICLLIQLKFVGLNNYVSKLVEESDSSMQKLHHVQRW